MKGKNCSTKLLSPVGGEGSLVAQVRTQVVSDRKSTRKRATRDSGRAEGHADQVETQMWDNGPIWCRPWAVQSPARGGERPCRCVR
jgi:hypothetical protein